ncbi:ndufa8, NADH-ubiquinone oxidoreductase complex I 19kd subunit [Sorochytrium milnesiophthora]
MSDPDKTPIFTAAVYVNQDAVEGSQLPPMSEVGATSAPLTSAAFFIGAHCKAYNEDFMLCKDENPDPKHCLKEGRKVTRCAMDLLAKIKASCGEEFKAHWQCLDNKNHEAQYCRKQERVFNDCVFQRMGLQKHIPDTPKGEKPIHLKEKPIYH